MTEELRSQRTASLSLNPRARGTKRKQHYCSPGAGATWNDLEPRPDSQAHAGATQKRFHSRGRKHGQMLPVTIRSRSGARTWLLPSSLSPGVPHWLPLSGSVRGSRKLVPRDAGWYRIDLSANRQDTSMCSLK